MPTLFRSTQRGEYTSPRTVLGFYAGVLIILEAGVFGITALLATNDDLHYLVPWVIGFGAAALLGVIIVVVAMNVRDPTKLQLGRVTGKEFLAYQQVTRGDSIAGEYIDQVPVPVPSAPIIEAVGSEGAAENEAEDGSRAQLELPDSAKRTEDEGT